MQYWDNWIATYKRMKLNYYFMLYLKIEPKWIKDINVRAEITKWLEVSTEENLHDPGFHSFLDVTLKAPTTNK